MTELKPSRLRIGFQTKVLLIYTGAALALVFVAFAAGSVYINRLQKSNVRDAVLLAQDQAAEVGRRVTELLAQRPLGESNNPATNQQIQGLLEFNLRLNRTVSWVGYFDEAGNCVVERNSLGETIVRLPENAGEARNIEMPLGGPGQLAQLTVQRKTATGPTEEHEVRQELLGDGRKLGEIRMKVAESPVYLRMAEASNSITGALAAGCVALLIVLVAVYAVVSRLFTRQVELVRHAERMDRMAYVGTLASGLAHEIRNPLSSMNVNLEVLREDLTEARDILVQTSATPEDATIRTGIDASARALDLAGRVQKEIGHLGTTLTHFLDFALPSKEGMTEFPLRGLVDEIVELHREQARQSGISVEVSGAAAEQSIIEADRRLCHQALRNILINAMQILSDQIPRQIRIRVESVPGPGVRVSISDTGPGIPPGHLESIFEAFVSGRKGGTGLGLALAKKIVEEHHGEIFASNNSDAPGATFHITFPSCQP